MRPRMVRTLLLSLSISLAAVAWSDGEPVEPTQSDTSHADASPAPESPQPEPSSPEAVPVTPPALEATGAQYYSSRHGRSSSSSSAFRPTSQSSFYISIPIWQNVDHDVVRTGASIEGRAGYDLGVIVPEVELGFAWIPVDLDKIQPGLGRDSLSQIFVGLGLRFQARNQSALTPYLSVAFDFNWWNFRETDYACGPWYCRSYDRYRFTPGISGRAGVSIAVRRSVALDLGVRLSMSFAGDFFPQSEWWVAPFFGFSLFY